MPNRPIKLSTLLTLARLKGPLGMGLAFVLGPLFLMLPALFFITSAAKKPYEQYDYQDIKLNGTTTMASVTNVAPVLNVSMNGQHPNLISYNYLKDGQPTPDNFQTMGKHQFKVGDIIQIKTMNGQSIIPTLEPFSFPYQLFLLVPAIFFVIGMPFLLVGLIPAIKNYKLYKNGIVKEATVLGISTKSIGFGNIRQEAFLVNYEYPGFAQPKLFGESTTNDLLLVNEKRFGDKVKIFVSERDETKSCLVPRLEAIKNNWAI
jgi:hypothetical protein